MKLPCDQKIAEALLTLVHLSIVSLSQRAVDRHMGHAREAKPHLFFFCLSLCILSVQARGLDWTRFLKSGETPTDTSMMGFVLDSWAVCKGLAC